MKERETKRKHSNIDGRCRRRSWSRRFDWLTTHFLAVVKFFFLLLLWFFFLQNDIRCDRSIPRQRCQQLYWWIISWKAMNLSLMSHRLSNRCRNDRRFPWKSKLRPISLPQVIERRTKEKRNFVGTGSDELTRNSFERATNETLFLLLYFVAVVVAVVVPFFFLSSSFGHGNRYTALTGNVIQ